MKKSIMIAITAMAILAAAVNTASAKDVLLRDQIVKDVAVAYTKNSKEYVRIILSEARTLNGVNYTVGVPVMVFEADLLDAAKAVTPGAKI